MIERQIPENKTCTKCKEVLSVSAFSRDWRHSDGLMSHCTKCRVSDNKSRKLKHKLLGLCQWCGLRPPRTEKATCKECSDKSISWRRATKQKVIDHYGGKCQCCGETAFEFLTIDHINGGGSKHRKQIKYNFNTWIVQNNFPTDLQLLCMNCNFAKGIYGKCPHEK